MRDDTVTVVVVDSGATFSVRCRRRGQEVGVPAVGGDDGVGCVGVVGLGAGDLWRVGRRESERLAAGDGIPSSLNDTVPAGVPAPGAAADTDTV